VSEVVAGHLGGRDGFFDRAGELDQLERVHLPPLDAAVPFVDGVAGPRLDDDELDLADRPVGLRQRRAGRIELQLGVVLGRHRTPAPCL
jgi:hypothetical protein